MIYYTSKDVFDKIYELAIDFFRNLNEILKVKNFVLHSEFKFEDILFPIEMNAMRYGGMGLGNMMYHTIGLDPYECFDIGKGPYWNSIWKKYINDNFVYFIAYNGTNVNFLTQEPDIEKLKNEFSVIQCEKLFDYKSQLTFGIFCIKEDFNNIQRLLNIDFNDYFKDIKK